MYFRFDTPGTYASIIATLKNREYVETDGKPFIPTDIGRIVNGFLTEHFTQYVDYDFTAKLEDDLDEIARSECRADEALARRFLENYKRQRDLRTGEPVVRPAPVRGPRSTAARTAGRCS